MLEEVCVVFSACEDVGKARLLFEVRQHVLDGPLPRVHRARALGIVYAQRTDDQPVLPTKLTSRPLPLMTLTKNPRPAKPAGPAHPGHNYATSRR